MAKIQLSEFKDLTHPGTYVFIGGCKYDPDFGKIEVQMVTVRMKTQGSLPSHSRR